jgi:hypothetical protein
MLTSLCSFRSDWMYIGDSGQVNTIINMRGWGQNIVSRGAHSPLSLISRSR